MRNSRARVLVLVSCVSLTPVSFAQHSSETPRTQKPSLEETESWIKQTFTNENTGRKECQEYDPDSTGNPNTPYYWCAYSKYESVDFAECKVTLKIHPDSGRLGKSGFKMDPYDNRNDSIVTFSLSDIDPNSIKADAPHGIFDENLKKLYGNTPFNVPVHLGTTNEKNVISVEYPNGLTKANPSKIHDCCGISEWGITVRPDYAPRLVNALRHAVELCGGKTSPF